MFTVNILLGAYVWVLTSYSILLILGCYTIDNIKRKSKTLNLLIKEFFWRGEISHKVETVAEES